MPREGRPAKYSIKRERITLRHDPVDPGTDTVTIGCKWPNGLVMRC
jgi:hypothetical protein